MRGPSTPPTGRLGRCRTCGSPTTWSIANAARRTRPAGPRAASLQLRLADDAVRSAVFGGGASFEDGDLTAARGRDPVRRRGRTPGARCGGAGGAVAARRRAVVAHRTTTSRSASRTPPSPPTARCARCCSRRRAGRGAGGAEAPATSALLADEQAVNVNADRVTSAAGGDRFVYSGEAMLWQGETAIRAETIDLDREGGNLHGRGRRAHVAADEGGARQRPRRHGSATTTACAP